MSQKKETGIVLSKKSSGEADNICTIYTKNSGKEKFIFRGLKKSARRPRTASEPGTILDLLYYTGKSGGLNNISEFDILKTYSEIRKSSYKIFSLYWMLELIDVTTGLSDANTKIFNLLSAGIETLAGTLHPKHFIIFFTVKYLILQGVFPDTRSCSWCGSEVKENLVIENSVFKTACINCTEIKSAKIRSRGTDFINNCVQHKLDKIDCVKYCDADINPALVLLINYINAYFNIKTKTGPLLIGEIGDN
jgi:DNA repair protein RecO